MKTSVREDAEYHDKAFLRVIPVPSNHKGRQYGNRTHRVQRIFYSTLLLLVFLVCVFAVSCNSGTDSLPPQTEKGSWAIYTPYDWTHDGEPFESVWCTIYSDSAGPEMKQQLGKIADEAFIHILQLFNFENTDDFLYPPGYSKIEVYLNIDHDESINWAYWGGFIMTIRSSSINGYWLDYTLYTATHELTHVFEFLIEGRDSLASDFWFKEGIAVHVGCMRSTIYKTITTLDELENWLSQNLDVPGQGNPVYIHHYDDLPEGANLDQYYRFFELATRYLFDPKGMDRSYPVVTNLFFDLRQEISFSDFFKIHFGIGLGDYEGQFYNRMITYLSSSSH